MTDPAPAPAPAPAPLPPCRVLVRTKRDVELFEWTTNDREVAATCASGRKLLEGCATTGQILAPNGKFALVHISTHGVVKLNLQEEPTTNNPSDSAKLKPPAFLEHSAAVQMMHLSPQGSFLLTWERFHAETCPKNLKVWDVATGKLLAGFPQKNLSRDSWPYLQWTVDEQYAFLMASTQIRVYQKADILAATTSTTTEANPDPRYIDRLQVEGSNISVPQQQDSIGGTVSSWRPLTFYYISIFSSKSNNKPATVNIYQYTPPDFRYDPATGSPSSSLSFELQASKSLFQAEECITHWSPQANACLLSLQTAVDNSGQSYYGSSLLFLWNELLSDEILAVPLPQQGPVQAVAWFRKPPFSFLAIAGRMPAMTSQHHGQTGAVTFLFGNNVHRNTISVSPHARFVCLAGFGNLAGGMGFWDVNKKKLLPHSAANATGRLQAEATVTMHSWAPDSRSFLVATTAPRMNVDNGIHLYKYTGEKIPEDQLPWKNESFRPNQLLEACFVPAALETYPDRPQSPPPVESVVSNDTTAKEPVAEVKPPVARYVPPSARNRGSSSSSGTSLAERMRKEKEDQVIGATAVTAKSAAALLGQKPTIPGMTASSVSGGSKSKSQLKRDKMKKQKEQKELRQQQQQQTSVTSEPAISTTTTTAANEPPDAEVDVGKRARKLKKLLKQIDDLKKIPDLSLNADQKAKLESEDSLRAELATLELQS